jgi:hypothetical protein
MTTPDTMQLLNRIIDAYDTFTAAEIDLKPHEIEPFRAALMLCIDEADALTDPTPPAGAGSCSRSRRRLGAGTSGPG